MFDLVITDDHSDRDILIHILKELKAMSLDLSNVNNALVKLDTDVAALITADAAVAAAVAAERAINQSQVDGLVPAIAALSAKAEDALTPKAALSAKAEDALTPKAEPAPAPVG